MRQLVPAGHLVGERKLRQVLLFLADVRIAILDADDEVAVVGGVGDRHAGVLHLPAVEDHAIVLGQLPSAAKLRDKAVTVEEEPYALAILGIDEPVRVLRGGLEEGGSLVLDLELAGSLLRGILGVLRGLAVDVVDQVVMVRQSLGDLRIGDGLLLVGLAGELRLHLLVDVSDADDDVLAVSCHDL